MSAVAFNRVAIVGAGAIGGWLGVHLARAGVNLGVLARGDTLKTLQKQACSCIRTARCTRRR